MPSRRVHSSRGGGSAAQSVFLGLVYSRPEVRHCGTVCLQGIGLFATQRTDTAAQSASKGSVYSPPEARYCGTDCLQGIGLFATTVHRPCTAAQSASKGSVYLPPEARFVSRQRLQSRDPKSSNFNRWHFAEIRGLRAAG